MSMAAKMIREAAEELARKANSYRVPVSVTADDANNILDWPLARNWCVAASQNSTTASVIFDTFNALTEAELEQVYCGAFTKGAERIVGEIVMKAIQRAVAEDIARQANLIDCDAVEPVFDDPVRADRRALARASR